MQTIKTDIPSGDNRVALYIKEFKILVSTCDPDPIIYNVRFPLFKAMEKYFDDWKQNRASAELYEMYTGRFEEMNNGPYLNKKGAVIDAIDHLLDYAASEGLSYVKSSQWAKMDLESAFEA